MKRPATLLLAALVLLPLHAQMGKYAADFTLSRTDFADSIAIEFIDNLVLVPVEVEGQRMRFLLDTGAGQAVVYRYRLIEGMRPDGHIISHDAVGRTDTVQMVRLPHITIGSTTFSGLQATLQQRAPGGHFIDGIIGFDLVCRGLSMKIDVQNHLLILTDRKTFFDGETGFECRYRLNFHVPYVEVNPFDRYKEQALFDTGSRQLYAMNKQSFDRGEAKADGRVADQVETRCLGSHAMGHQGVEPRGEVVYLRLKRLDVGGLGFTNVATLTSQGGSHLGAQVLNHAAVTFLPQRQRMRLQPYNGGNECPVDNTQPDIFFISLQGRPAVGVVRPGSQPYLAGFREGDVIQMVDDTPVTSTQQWASWRYLKGHVYTFTLRPRKGLPKIIRSIWPGQNR